MNVFEKLRSGQHCHVRDDKGNGNFDATNFLTPPFQIDCACRMFLGKNIFANHGK
ncbi:MAG: hypothetical protein IKN16_08585 [Selenomonadaceae bacterium]|nr:hypothetical protein [Selenomonadaceae bacterium]MBR6888485.1 hypothetical protein [Selenomonadaceae bacterium]